MVNPTVTHPHEAKSVVERMKDDANRIEYETDSRGRKIGVRKLTALDMFDLSLLMGQNAQNAAAMNQALVAFSVTDIDGITTGGRFSSTVELRACIQRLDFPGFQAATKALERFDPPAAETEEAIKN